MSTIDKNRNDTLDIAAPFLYSLPCFPFASTTQVLHDGNVTESSILPSVVRYSLPQIGLHDCFRAACEHATVALRRCSGHTSKPSSV